MTKPSKHKADAEILTLVKAELTKTFGDRIDKIVLFGSRAKARARANSDYDIALFLKDMRDLGEDARQIGPITDWLQDNKGVLVRIQPLRCESWNDRSIPLIDDIRSSKHLQL